MNDLGLSMMGAVVCMNRVSLRRLLIELLARHDGSCRIESDQQARDIEVDRVGLQLQRALVGFPAVLRVGQYSVIESDELTLEPQPILPRSP